MNKPWNLFGLLVFLVFAGDVAGTSSWQTVSAVDPMDGTVRTSATVRSANAVKDFTNETHTIELLVRCERGQQGQVDLDLLLVFPNRLFVPSIGALQVRWRVDAQPVEDASWQSSHSALAAFSPYPERMLPYLKLGETLHVDLVPPLGTRQYVTFPLQGAATAIEKVEASCFGTPIERLRRESRLLVIGADRPERFLQIKILPIETGSKYGAVEEEILTRATSLSPLDLERLTPFLVELPGEARVTATLTSILTTALHAKDLALARTAAEELQELEGADEATSPFLGQMKKISRQMFITRWRKESHNLAELRRIWLGKWLRSEGYLSSEQEDGVPSLDSLEIGLLAFQDQTGACVYWDDPSRECADESFSVHIEELWQAGFRM